MTRRRGLAEGFGVLILGVVLLPAPWLLQMSFRHNDEIMNARLSFVPTLENYTALWNGQFPGSFVHSLLASGFSTAFSLLLGVQAAPGLAATGILCFILSWNDFFFALILTRTRAMTAPVAIVNFMQYAGWEWGKIAAAGVLVMLPVLVFTFLVRAYLVRGLMAGGAKE
jgi:ABC-type glycerol-3-phosphate transport system permease component